MSKETAKSGLLNGRYILSECLFSNELGQLYHARDTRHSAGIARGANVLVHLFPGQTISYIELANTFNRLRTMINASSYPVLPVLDYGWVDSGAYFVMANTGSWSAKVLPSLQGSPSSLHRDAMHLISQLLKEQLISRGLVPQAFLVIPGGVKILGTALTEQFQKIQLEMNLLPPAPNHKKGRKIVYTMFGFSVLAGIAAAGGTYFYQQSELINKAVIKKSAIHPEPTLTTPANNPAPTIIDPIIETPVAGATEPEQEKPLLLSQQDKPSPVPENMAISSPIISIQTKEAEKPLAPTQELESEKAPEPEKPQIQSASPVTIETEEAQEPELIIQSPEILTQTTAIVSMEDIADPLPVTEFPVKKPDNGNKDHIITAPAEKQSDTPLTSTDTSSDQDETAEKKMDQQATSVSKDVKIDEEKLTANGLNRKQLIERAYNAIEKGNLSEQADSGSIYYIRLLKRISPTHPQVRRLAREVVSAYHIKARASIKLKQTRNASQHLWIAGRIIEEFSLSEINKAQLVLKQRLAE